jgi:hypothetical protein
MAQSMMKKNLTRKVKNAKKVKKSRGGYPAVKVKTTSKTRISKSRKRVRGGM